MEGGTEGGRQGGRKVRSSGGCRAGAVYTSVTSFTYKLTITS